MGLRVMQNGTIVDERKRKYDRVHYGLDAASARTLAATARVVIGNFPRSEEVTGGATRISAAISNTNPEEELFTYAASHYRGLGGDILLLDYRH